MKTKRNLRSDRVDEQGYAPIRFIIHLNGERFYIDTKEKCKPEHWVKEVRLLCSDADYHNEINEKLVKLDLKLNEIANRFRFENKILTSEILLREFEAAITPKTVDVEEKEPEQANSLNFIDLMVNWKYHQETKINVATGRPLASSTIRGIQSTIERFKKYEEKTGNTLTFEGMDMKFYQSFQHYVLVELEQTVNNFGKHIDRLKSFLAWAEIQHDAPVNRKYNQFTSPEIYVGADALSAAELNSIYKIDFTDPETRKKLFKIYQGKGTIQNEESQERFSQWVVTMEKARDIFLCCCYTGMRISDATTFTMLNINVQQNFIYLKATKTTNECFIPFYDDVLFKPKELLMKYWMQFNTCMPPVAHPEINSHLKYIQELIKLERLSLTSKIGRKTFVTLKLY